MALNTEGILQLAADLFESVSHRNYFYDQNTFGNIGDDVASCGTVCCLAGFCLRREVGQEKYQERIREWHQGTLGAGAAIDAGARQLGLDLDTVRAPRLFGTISTWPDDLREEYCYSRSARDRVIVGLRALQRLLPDGTIDEVRSAVHTPIPQLCDLLAEQRQRKK